MTEPTLKNTQEDYLKFLKLLEKSEAPLNSWEAEFTSDNVKRDEASFSDKQVKCIKRMMDKYADAIGW